MKQIYKLNIQEAKEFLIYTAIHRPVFLWGAPGIGKSNMVEQFAEYLSMECVTLLGSQLAPEDLIGVPQIVELENGKKVSKFIPPSMLVRDKPFVLFLDELNLACPEVQKAFYSLILNQRVGELELPKGSIIIGAGNRSSDSALVSTMNSAIISRMVHVTIEVSSSIWLEWAKSNGINEYVIDFISQNPTFLSTEIPPAEEEVFSTPRTWHALSDILNSYKELPPEKILKVILQGCLSPNHRTVFEGFCKLKSERYIIHDIIEGKRKWPQTADKKDLLLYLANSFRQILQKELPKNQNEIQGKRAKFVNNIKEAMESLVAIDKEFSSLLIDKDEKGQLLPQWFLMEIAKHGNVLID
jgi:hypothetical protein